MNKYNGGIIYALKSYQTDKIYIGSTLDIIKRFYFHKKFFDYYTAGVRNDASGDCKYKFTTSFHLLRYDDCYIDILEFFSCCNKSELTKREGQLIKQYRDVAVNRKVEGRTSKEYSKDNSDILNARSKLYNDLHKDRIKERSSLKTSCICGGRYTAVNKSQHINGSQLHRNFKTETWKSLFIS